MPAWKRQKPAPDHNRRESEAAGVVELLPLRSGGKPLQGAGRLASAETALHSVAAVETSPHPSQKPDQTGTVGRCIMAFGKKPAWPMVARRDKCHASCSSKLLLRQPWPDIATESVQPTSARIMNRRIRNRSYGGVGGRRGRPRLLPDWVSN